MDMGTDYLPVKQNEDIDLCLDDHVVRAIFEHLSCVCSAESKLVQGALSPAEQASAFHEVEAPVSSASSAISYNEEEIALEMVGLALCLHLFEALLSHFDNLQDTIQFKQSSPQASVQDITSVVPTAAEELSTLEVFMDEGAARIHMVPSFCW